MNIKKYLSILLMLPVFLVACTNKTDDNGTGIGTGTDTDTDLDSDADTDADTDTDTETENSITIKDQKPSKNILVEEANLNKTGFVVIHEVDRDGNPGTIVGKSALLQPGVSKNLTVTLDRNTEDGEDFVAMLHTDNGDRIFDELKDAPAIDEDDNEVIVDFAIDADVGGTTSN